MIVSCIVDNFISKNECKKLIELYHKYNNLSFNFRDVYPLSLTSNTIKESDFVQKKLNDFVADRNAIVDWLQIVKWPLNSKQALHLDLTGKDTVLSSILYLNEDFKGGETYFKDGTIFKPKTGRAIFFNGVHYKHGVNPVKDNTRFTVASWFKKGAKNP